MILNRILFGVCVNKILCVYVYICKCLAPDMTTHKIRHQKSSVNKDKKIGISEYMHKRANTNFDTTVDSVVVAIRAYITNHITHILVSLTHAHTHTLYFSLYFVDRAFYPTQSIQYSIFEYNSGFPHCV